MFCSRPGTPAPPRLISQMAISSSTLTIHSVKIVDVIEGWKMITSPPDGGSGPIRTCGAGNSSVPLMKQTGNAHGSAGFSGFERVERREGDDVEDDDDEQRGDDDASECRSGAGWPAYRQRSRLRQ